MHVNTSIYYCPLIQVLGNPDKFLHFYVNIFVQLHLNMFTIPVRQILVFAKYMIQQIFTKQCFQLLENFFYQARQMIRPQILIYFYFCKTLPVIVFLFLISIILIQILIYHVSFPTNMITTKYLFQSFLQFCKLITIFDIVSFNSQSKITNFDLKVINSIIKQYLFIEQIDFLKPPSIIFSWQTIIFLFTQKCKIFFYLYTNDQFFIVYRFYLHYNHSLFMYQGKSINIKYQILWVIGFVMQLVVVVCS
eukprot:TRINITY_DN6062_c0_g1_i1.p1 TRINITY_DN6062_c0_g1~~TRINITY_DN6062_c0_g1_i1.p1  ORF type:complete len:249 (+),score=-40.19 TRINITY_DN6062_c0_g1_i1:315-1061(+)